MQVCRLVLTLLLCWSSSNSFAQCPANPVTPNPEMIQRLMDQASDHGFLWKVSKNGWVSWLYGTIHANRLDGVMPGLKTRAALQQSDALAVELDISDNATLSEIARLGRQGAGKIPRRFQSRLNAQLEALCLPASLTQQLHPILLFGSMMVMAGKPDGIETDFGTDLLLISAAKTAQKPVIALETAAEQINTLIGGDRSVSEAEIESALSQIESGSARKQLSKMVDAWIDSDLSVMENYRDWCECEKSAEDRRVMKRLLDDRNLIMAQRIDELLRKDQSLFVAVGSLHMIGKGGLPSLLRAKAYQVELVLGEPLSSHH
ncbi:TraB/GumN family protein [Chitinibacter sp. S2-10]|uniref:TraB/GumN family protein n=1 Tax=Chitinibacter sp. S2-10 TaxID=3373597 RepID=UPI003977790E